MQLKNEDKNKNITILFLVLTIALTWLFQFMPMIMGLDIQNTSISSFDFASLFFTMGGLMPTLIAVIFVLIFYTKEGIKDFMKRCFVPDRECALAILISLGFSFIISCMSAALVYTVIYVISKRKVFPIFFLHMFKNIILTGAMIYPFSKTYSIVVLPVEIVIDLLFYVIISRTSFFKSRQNECYMLSGLRQEE